MLRIYSYRLSLLLALLCFTGTSYGQQWSGVLSSARATDWSQAGISGGIPSASWTKCGPTIGPYTGSPSTIINALNHTGSGYTSCTANQYIQLGAGTFNLNGSIRSIGVSNTELRGMGADQTHLVFSAASTCQGGNGTCLVGFESSDGTYPGQSMTPSNWTSGFAKGSTSITLSSGANINANSTMLVLDQCDTGYSGAPCAGSAKDNNGFYVCSDSYSTSGPTGCSASGPDTGFARPHRYQMEIVQATACSPSCGSSGTTTVTITPGLKHPNWSSSQTPQVWLVQPASNVGFKDFSVNGAGTSNTAGVGFNNTSNFWCSGVAILNSYNIGIFVIQSVHGQIENNYIYNAGQNLNYSDSVGVKYNGSNNLFQNNIIEASHASFMAEGPASGTVVAYNFTINSYTNNDFMYGSIWQHSTGDDYELYEGNVANQMQMDDIHGSHLSETFYRNFFTGWESCANGQCGTFPAKDVSTTAIVDASNDRYGNFIANVLGTPGFTTTYTSNSSSYMANASAFVLGGGNQGGAVPIPFDTIVGATSLRWGNYDTSSAAVRWDDSEIPTGISLLSGTVPTSSCTSSAPCPASFYLPAQPSWWPSSIPFPAIGPDVTGGNVGQVSGTLNAPGHQSGNAAINGTTYSGNTTANAWGGHINAIPAMACYLAKMGGLPDGSGSALTFSAANCYPTSASAAQPPAPPSGLSAFVQ